MSAEERIRIRCLIAGLVVLTSGCLDGSTGLASGDGSSAAVRWQVFSVDQMRDQRAQQGTSFLEVLADSAFRMGLSTGRPGSLWY